MPLADPFAETSAQLQKSIDAVQSGVGSIDDLKKNLAALESLDPTKLGPDSLLQLGQQIQKGKSALQLLKDQKHALEKAFNDDTEKLKSELEADRTKAIGYSDKFRQTPFYQQIDDAVRANRMIGRLFRKAGYEIVGDYENYSKKKPQGGPTGRPWLADAGNRPAWMTIDKAAYYLKYPSATYGTWYFVGDHYPAGPRQLLIDAWRTAQFALWRLKTFSSPEKVINDNVFSLNSLCITLRTGIAPTDLVYVNYSDRVSETCFYVALDHIAKAVVVAIRGTDSLEDCITDLLGYPAKLTELRPKVPKAFAHGGILNAARYVVAKLKSEKVLEKAFKLAPDYQLVVVGHSLGAGTASLTALLLHESDYPNVTCFAYEPPGWMVSKDVSDYAKSFILSVVHGDDMVPRISLTALKKLDPEAAVKAKILDLLLKSPAASKFEFLGAKLVVPGQILYLEKTVQGGIATQTVYDPRSADPESFEGIVVTSQFLHDHLEDKVQEALNYGRDRIASYFQ